MGLKLNYKSDIWEEIVPVPKNTLQLFITNKCNLRCKGCFYKHKLNQDEMSFSEYQTYINAYLPTAEKIILLGGEPTLHPDLPRMIACNQNCRLPTTIYTNGSNLKILKDIDLTNVEVRVGIYGAYKSEKPLINIPKPPFPITVVYMLRKDNVCELLKASKLLQDYNCRKFYVSSIRDIAQTHDFWLDTEETISPYSYAEIINIFINDYQGDLSEIHLARRGVLETELTTNEVKACRFGNIFPDGEKIICPLDISNRITVPELKFNSVPCNKKGCLLQKIVLRQQKQNLRTGLYGHFIKHS